MIGEGPVAPVAGLRAADIDRLARVWVAVVVPVVAETVVPAVVEAVAFFPRAKLTTLYCRGDLPVESVSYLPGPKFAASAVITKFEVRLP